MNRTTHLIAHKRYDYTQGNANRRGIAFELTFDQWYNWWLSHGIDKNLPSNNSQYCMCRHNDTGPYRLDNIYFATRGQNTKDRHIWNPRRGEKNPNFGNRGSKNPLSKPIQTPAGRFGSRIEAAQANNMTPRMISSRLKTKSKDYFYI